MPNATWPMLTVTEVCDAAQLAAYQTEWSTLVDGSPDGSFFETPDWLLGWLGAFWSPRPIAFRFVHDDGALVGFAPFLADEARDAWCRHTLTLPRHSHVPKGNVVAAAGRRDVVLEALLRHSPRSSGVAPFVFAGVDRAAPVWAGIAAAARARGLATALWDEPLIPWVRLGRSWDDYLATRSSHLRSELRRKRRKLEKSGKLELRTVTAPHQVDAALAAVTRIERASWKQEAGTSLDTEPGAAPFYAELARRAAGSGRLRLHLMYLDGAPVAHLLGLVYKNEYLAFKTSYDQSRRDLSPGAVLFEHALRDACEQHLASFDLLGVESRWKNELATDMREPTTICVFRPTSATCQSCRVFERVVKPRIKRRARWLVSFAQLAASVIGS